MREQSSYTFNTSEITPFTIKFGDVEVLEQDNSLFDNAYPNPFSHSLNVRFNLSTNQDVYDIDISVFSPVGRKVKTITSGSMTSGYHEIPWDGRDDHGHEVTGGIYIIRMTVNTGRDSHNYVQRVIKR